MSIDPRTELTRLLDALEAHLTAVVNRTGEHDPAVDEAYVEIAKVTPLSVYGDEDEDDLEEILDDEDDIDDDIEYED